MSYLLHGLPQTGDGAALDDPHIAGGKPHPLGDLLGVQLLKKAQEEADQKLAAAKKELEAAGELKKKLQNMLDKAAFEESRVAVKSVKGQKKKVTITWKKVEGAEGYVIQYATKSNFKGKKSITIKSGTAVTRTIRKLSAKKTYYVRIKAYKVIDNETVYTKYSVKKKARTK